MLAGGVSEMGSACEVNEKLFGLESEVLEAQSYKDGQA